MEENEEEDDLWGLLRIEDDIFEDGGLPVLTDNVVQVRPDKGTRDSSAHDVSHVGDQSGGQDDNNHPDPSPVTSSTFAVSSQAANAIIATIDHTTLPGHDKFEQDGRIGNNKDVTTDHLGGGMEGVPTWMT